MLIALAAAAIPAFAVLISVVISSQGLNKLSLNFQNLDRGFEEMNRRLDDMKHALPADLLRFERVMDARVKRLEGRKLG